MNLNNRLSALESKSPNHEDIAEQLRRVFTELDIHLDETTIAAIVDNHRQHNKTSLSWFCTMSVLNNPHEVDIWT